MINFFLIPTKYGGVYRTGEIKIFWSKKADLYNVVRYVNNVIKPDAQRITRKQLKDDYGIRINH